MSKLLGRAMTDRLAEKESGMKSNKEQGFIEVMLIAFALVLVVFIVAVTASTTSMINECIKSGGSPIIRGDKLEECKR